MPNAEGNAGGTGANWTVEFAPIVANAGSGNIRFAGGKNGAWLCYRAHTDDPDPVTCGNATADVSPQPTITANQNGANVCTRAQADWETNPISLLWEDASVDRISWIHCAAADDSDSNEFNSKPIFNLVDIATRIIAVR